MKAMTIMASFAAALVVAATASASFPGTNGRIVFQSNRHGGVAELYSMNPDATDVRRLTWNAVADRLPRFSPDGSRIVFARTVAGIDQDIWIMNADGSGERQLTSGSARDDAPVFTRDGKHVVFQRVAGPVACPCELRIVGADGEGERLLDTGAGNAVNPDVSKNGKLAFASDRHGTLSIYVSDLRGGPVKRVTEGPAAFGDFRPRWSPRGNDLVFMRDDGTSFNDIYTVHQDGTDLRQLTSGSRFEEQAQWSPDGERIVFGVFDTGPPFGSRLHMIDADDGSDERQLPQLAVPYLETYDDERRDEAFWHEIRDPGSTIGESDGRLVISIAGTATPGGQFNQIAAHWGSNCRLAGDFDYQVDYELLTWPRNNGYFAALNGFFGDAAVARHSNPWDPPFDEQYSGWRGGSDFANGVLNTTDRAGSLRLVRSGASIATYVRSPGENWTLVFGGGGVVGVTVMGTGLSVPGWAFVGKDASVAFDDFRLNSGELTCPSWWRDFGPDWAASG